MGSPGVAGYCASKAAVIGLVRTAAKENPHVRMNCVAPGKFNNVSYIHIMRVIFQAISFWLFPRFPPPLFLSPMRIGNEMNGKNSF